MIQFYSPDIENTHALGVEESGHCVRVLRKKEGDIIYVTDGKGDRFECIIKNADSRVVKLEILNTEKIKKSWAFNITLVVAPTKNADRMAWLVEKCTEIGIDSIYFLDCRRNERKNINIDRLRRNAISAMNQSLKTRLPQICGMVKFDRVTELPGEKFFGYCNTQLERKDFVKELSPGSDVVIVIGPEGDFSEEEVDFMLKKEFRAVTFGEERLRTETAALYGVTAIHVKNDLNK